MAAINQKTRLKNFPAKYVVIGLVLGAIALVIGISFFGGVMKMSNLQPKPTLPPFPSAPVAPDELVIKFREDMTPQDLSGNKKKQLDEKLKTVGVISSAPLFEKAEAPLNRYYLIKLTPGTDLEKTTSTIYEFDEVEYVGPNTIYEIL